MDLSSDEKWVIYDIMLDRLGFGPAGSQGTDPFVCVLAIIEKLERDRADFSPMELDRIREACRRYSRQGSTPETDREVAMNIADRIEQSPPTMANVPPN